MSARKANAARINLGEGWRQFGFDRPDLEYLGVIRRGLEVGALARDTDGRFLQVNGDMRQTLNTSRIQALLRDARPPAPRPTPVTRQPTAEQRASVVVTVKPKRRVIVTP